MEAVGRLAGGVAHDFNNVLTAIFGYADLLLDQFTADDPRRADVQEIRRAAERAAALTRQLLAFSRKQMMQPRVLDLNDVVASLQTLLSRLVGEDITLEIGTAAEVWTVRADPGQIEQMLMNLAANARDAMPEGGRLTIATGNAHVDERMRGTSRAQAGRVRDDDRIGHRNRRARERPPAHVRAVLHDQGPGQGDRARTGDGLRDREAEQRRHLCRQRGREGDALRDLSAARPLSVISFL